MSRKASGGTAEAIEVGASMRELGGEGTGAAQAGELESDGVERGDVGAAQGEAGEGHVVAPFGGRAAVRRASASARRIITCSSSWREAVCPGLRANARAWASAAAAKSPARRRRMPRKCWYS